MSAKNIYLWVTSLVMVALTASCSGMAGSPIQGNLDADANTTASDEQMAQVPGAEVSKEADFRPAFFDVFTEDSLGMPGDIPVDAAGDDDAKAASYTPGLMCNIGGGIGFPSVLNYGWKNGIVTEGALAPSVTMTSAVGTPMAWIAYGYKEVVAGRLQNFRLEGQGKQLAVFMYNWNSPGWGYFGTHDLVPGVPVNIPVGIDYAPNGLTFVVLVQLPTYTTTITRTQTNVF